MTGHATVRMRFETPTTSGKTHAARYFSQEKVLQALSEEVGVPPPLSLILSVPRGGTDVFRGIYLNIIGMIGLERISRFLSELAEKLGDEFQNVTRSLVNGPPAGESGGTGQGVGSPLLVKPPRRAETVGSPGPPLFFWR